jgi:hypothetical protein
MMILRGKALRHFALKIIKLFSLKKPKDYGGIYSAAGVRQGKFDGFNIVINLSHVSV